MKRKVGLRREPEPMIYAKDCVDRERRFSRSGERAGNNFVVMDKMRDERRVVPKETTRGAKKEILLVEQKCLRIAISCLRCVETTWKRMVENEKVGSGPRRSSVVGMDEGESAMALEGESAMKEIFPDFDD